MQLKPSIKTPCPADWSQMKLGVNSRFCSSCEKSVVDFTTKSREEIIEYLLLNSQQNTCGRLYKSQLDYSNIDFEVMVRSIAAKQKDPRTSLSVLIIGSMLAMSCQNPNSTITESFNDTIIIGDTIEMVETTKSDSLQNDSISGQVCSGVMKPDTVASLGNEPIEIIMGEVITGDIAIDLIIEPDSTSGIRAKTLEPIQYAFAEIKPEFPGGMEGLMSWIAKNTEYPESAKQAKIEAKVFVQFLIDKTGKVTKPTVVRGTNSELDSVAIKSISAIPDWIPGEVEGQKVDVIMIIPVNFRL